MRGRALALLTRREHSRRELQRKLAARGFSDEDIAPVLDALESGGWLSDARFAAAYLDARAGRGFGPLRIREELRQRGVDSAVVACAFESSEVDWDTGAARARVKRFGEPLPDSVPERARQQRFLHARGFEPSQCRAALSTAHDWDDG